MDVPVPRTWPATPVILSVGELNVNSRDPLSYLLSPPMAIIRKDGASQSHDGGPGFFLNPQFPIVWDNRVLDTDNGWDGTSKYTAQTAGWYHLVAQVQYAEESAPGGDSMRMTAFRKNGQTFHSLMSRGEPFTNATKSYTISGHLNLNVGDYLEVMSGADNAFTIVGYNGSTYFGCQWEIRWLSAL